MANPDFSTIIYCDGGEPHAYGAALAKWPRRTASTPAPIFLHAPCIHGPLHDLATKIDEKPGLKFVDKGCVFIYRI